MEKQKQRENRIFSKLDLEKLPFVLNKKNFKSLGQAVSLVLEKNYNNKAESKKLSWIFSTVKRFKIFLEIFYANEKGEEIYKEIIARKIPMYSYKTISRIIDDGCAKEIYIYLEPDGESGTDAKIKNIRPSEDLMIDFLNWSIDMFKLVTSVVTEKKKE